MRRSGDFRQTIRSGKRSARPTLVAHVVRHKSEPTIVGFVVGKTVGPAIVRNKVKRRLRHLMRDRMRDVEEGSRLVIRALPRSSRATYSELETDLDAALRRSGARGDTV